MRETRKTFPNFTSQSINPSQKIHQYCDENAYLLYSVSEFCVYSTVCQDTVMPS